MKKIIFFLLIATAAKAQTAQPRTLNYIEITKDSTIDLNGASIALTSLRQFRLPAGVTLTIKNGKILPKLSFNGITGSGSSVVWKNVNNSEGYLKLR